MISEERLRELWANGFTITVMAGPFVEHFARAVEREARREERERCAKVCEQTKPPPDVEYFTYGPAYSDRVAANAQGHVDCAAAIRALNDET